jgi:hypothetical protein
VGAPTPYGHTSRRLLRWGPVLPILSVHATGLTSTLRSNGVRLLVAALLALVASIPFIGPFLVVVLLIQEVTLSLGNAQRSGAIDDLRVTLLEAKTLARDILTFYMRRGIIYVPALMIGAIQVALVLESIRFEPPNMPEPDSFGDSAVNALLYFFSVAAGVVGLGFLQVFAIVCVSCYMGISGRDIRRQVGIAIVIVGIAYALCIYGMVGQVALMYALKFRDAWYNLPLALAGCCVVFLMLAVSCRSELWRILDGGSPRQWRVLRRASVPHRAGGL